MWEGGWGGRETGGLVVNILSVSCEGLNVPLPQCFLDAPGHAGVMAGGTGSLSSICSDVFGYWCIKHSGQ